MDLCPILTDHAACLSHYHHYIIHNNVEPCRLKGMHVDKNQTAVNAVLKDRFSNIYV